MKLLLTTSLIVLAGVVSSASASQKPVIQVYYETLCGDSRRFIQRQLYPLKMSPLGEYFDVELIPYGKASTRVNQDSYAFDCQHGPEECKGNKLHACAIKQLSSSQSLEFVYCSMASSYPPNALTTCAMKVGLSNNEAQSIESCTNGYDGSGLLARHGERTNGLSPKLYFVPWITFNGVFQESDFKQTLSDLKTVMCRKLRSAGQTPEACEGTELTMKKADQLEADDSSSIASALYTSGFSLSIVMALFARSMT